MRTIYPYRTDGYAAYPAATHTGDERFGFFLPFVAGLAIGPWLAGGGYGGYGPGPGGFAGPPQVSYGPQFGPSYGPSYGPILGPGYGGPGGYGSQPGLGGSPVPPYGAYGSSTGDTLR
ncbi:hypothetical protein [Salicibibacter cibarius]|uniref:hypothetical protein n=1 Tax=Salicibibacter cibarius TaxID=2743000 RepID=UPI001FEA22D9|nr:hypothetical protein [Salicibibacter cibarius]